MKCIHSVVSYLNIFEPYTLPQQSHCLGLCEPAGLMCSELSFQMFSVFKNH